MKRKKMGLVMRKLTNGFVLTQEPTRTLYMPKMASSATPTTEPVESYHAIEDRITQAIIVLRERGGKPNISAAAREFHISQSRLRARWNGRKAKSDIIPSNRKLKEHQELAVCSYLDRLDKLGIPVHTPTITGYANSILRRAHGGDGPPPVVSEHWARRFLERHPQYLVRKQSARATDPSSPDTVPSNLPPPDSTSSPSPPSTPPSRHRTTDSELPTTPLTIRSLKRQADQLWHSDVNSPTFKQRLHTFISGSLKLAQAAAQAREILGNTLTAERELKARHPEAVLCAPEAGDMATERAEGELERAKGIADRAAKAESKKERKVFIDAITAKRKVVLKERADRKKLRKELCKEVRARARVLKKSRTCVDSS